MENNPTHYEVYKKHLKTQFFFSEGIAYGFLIPLTLVLVILILKPSTSQMFTIIAVALGIAAVGTIPFIFSYVWFLAPVFAMVKNTSEAAGKPVDSYPAARRRFFLFPAFHALNSAGRWVILMSTVLVVLSFIIDQTHLQKINLWLLVLINAIFSGGMYYLAADRFTEKIAALGMFSADLDGKSRLSSPLALTVISVSALGMVLMILLVLNIFYNAVTNAYINQMKNLAASIDKNIERFYDERLGDSKILLGNPALIESVKSGRYEGITRIFKKYYDTYGIYENIFISTPEKDSMIVASPVPGSVGLRYRVAGYGDNIDAALRGEMLFSSANKSPVTGLPVVLLTLPIREANRVVAILGMPIELGKFTSALLGTTRIGKSGYPFVTDGKLVITGHPDPKLLLTDINKFDFGKSMRSLPSGSDIRHMWQDRHKYLTFVKNEKYSFYSAATIYLSDIDETVIKAEIVLFTLAVAGLVLTGFFIVIFISRKLAPLKANEEIMEKLAAGELGHQIMSSSNDEIGRMSGRLNKFVDTLRSVLKNIQNISGEVATSSEEMSTAAVSFSDNAQNQAASAEQVTATVEEVSAGVENVAANTLEQFKRLGEFIKQMQKLSESINEMGDKLIETVKLSGDIAATAKSSENSLNDMTVSMSRISESSSEMTGIVDIINDISEKINLLSLNAAIEAARAGDAGRGFAVVADEISKLADQTASSIKEIDKFIRSNNEEISRGMGNVESAIETISTIISGVNRIGEMMNLLGEFMKKQLDTNALVNRDALEMRSRSEEMKGATEEQKTAVSEIVKSVSNINGLTQANASGAEEMAGTSESLASMAENLKRTVDYFKF